MRVLPGRATVHVLVRRLQRQRVQHAALAGGWEITYLGPTTYQINVSVETFETMAAHNPDVADRIQPLLERFRVIEPWLINGRAHARFWDVDATRVD